MFLFRHKSLRPPMHKWRDYCISGIMQLPPRQSGSVAITCGPPIMIHFTGKVLDRLGFAADQSYVTLEARMHCSIGKCGRCNLGEKLVCVDGLVFSMAEVGGLLESSL